MSDNSARPSILAIATRSQSLALQSPSGWPLLRNHHADITFAAARDSWTSRIETLGDFVELPGSRSALSQDHVRYLRGVDDLLSSRTWDLVQLQSPIASVLARAAPSLRRARRVLYVAHGFHMHADAPALQNFAVGRLEKLLSRRCDAVAVVSEEDFETAGRLGLGKHALLWQFPGAGVDTDAFAAASPLRPFDEDHIIFCGDLIARKQPLLALDIFERLRALGRDLPLVFIGDGVLAPQVAKRIETSGGRIHWIRQTDDVAGYIAGAGLHLMTSRQEGVPRVVMESMAAGVPTIALSNRGTRELSGRGAGPLLSRDATLDDWAALILRWFGTRLPRSAIEAVQHYSSSNFDQSYLDLLARMDVISPV